MIQIRKIGTLLILSVSLIVALAVAGIVIYVSNSSYNLALHLEKQSLTQASQAAQRGLDMYLNSATSVLRTLATDQHIANAFQGDAAKAQARIAEALKANPDVWSIAVFNDAGTVVAGANAQGESIVGQSRSDREYYKQIVAGKELFVQREIITAKTGGDEMYIFCAAQAVKGAGGKVLGGVGLFVRWSALTERFIQPLRFGERGYAFMLDEKGKIIAHGGDKSLMLKDTSSEGFIKKAMEIKKGEFFYDWKGERKYLCFESDPETGFMTCMSAYESDLTMAANAQRNMLLGIGMAAVLLLFGAVAFIVKRQVATPIARLQAFSNAVAGGNYSVARHGGYRFEFATLAADLHAMVDQLKERLGFAQGVLDGFVLPCSVFDSKNNTSFVNQHMLDALERPGKPADYIGQPSGQLIFGDASRETLSAKALREERTLHAESPYTTVTGKQKIFNVTSTPFKDLDGKLLGALAVWFELTDIRAQEQKIKEQNQRIAEAAAAANAVSDQVASASEELAAQIEQSSRGSDEQRSRTAEAATAMEEMNSTVMEVARSAGTAADLADRAKNQAQQGAKLVGEAVANITAVKEQAQELKADMTQLGSQAEGIGQIMGVISDIADQTNLLALNAAIEAARAGDAGRGFAVVADEVRKLAEKTMQATGEVGKHIRAVQDSARRSIEATESTTAAIQTSTELVQRSGQALQQIVSMVDETADQVRGIATASEEQSAASEEISRSTEDINRIAGETAEAMIQSGHAVSDLARLAGDLRGIISRMNG